MVKIFIWIFQLIIITLTLTLSIVSPGIYKGQAALESFSNGGFESDPRNSTNNWVWPANDWIWDSSIAHNSGHSARVYRGTGSETASIWSEYISVQSSTNYTLTYWLRTQNATWWPSVSIYQYKIGNIQTGPRLIAHANITAGTSTWNRVQYRFQTMPDATSFRVRVALFTLASGTYWFDDFEITEGSRALYPFHRGFPVVASGSVFYSSPVVANINNSGANELLIAGGSAINGWDRDGVILSGFPMNTGDKHIQTQIALADLDGDGDLELTAGTKTPVSNGQGRVFAWHHTGTLMSGWPKSVAWNSQYANNESLVSTIVLADIDHDQDFEILAGTSNNTARYTGSNPPAAPNLYAWHVNGALVAGQWPTWHNTAGIYGVLAAGDLNGDFITDVEVGRDHHYLNTYGSDGRSLPGWPIETYLNANSGRYDIVEHIDYNLGAPVIGDLDGDGEMEYIIAGFVGGPGAIPLHNSAVLVLEPDGTRRSGWETPALGLGIINPGELFMQAPALADLDQDGELEIIVATNDGWIRAYKANKTILWAFNYTQGALLGATEAVVGDIDGDNDLEVVFGTRVTSRQEGIYYNGPVGLWALNADGTVVPGYPLPVPTPGIFGAPTLADFDGDNLLEILVAAREGEVYVWDTSTPYNPMRLPWPTGRHDLRRSATYTPLLPLEASHKIVSPTFARSGQTVKFSIFIISAYPINETISLTDVIPTGLAYVPGSLVATAGTATQTGGVIQWSGNLSLASPVEINYNVIVTITTPQILINTAVFDTVTNGRLTRTAKLYANYSNLYLPAIRR